MPQSFVCISGVIYIALAKSVPAEALDIHKEDKQSLVTVGKAAASDESPRDGAKNVPRWEFCSEVFLVARGFSGEWMGVFPRGMCQVQTCSV